MAMLLTGCDFSVYSLPLPGGAKIKGPSYTVTVEFADVLDLVPKSSVKVDDVTVGTVEKVWLDGYVAKVRIKLPKSLELPDNARATIRQTSLLGEKFVSLSPPTGSEQPRGKLDNGEIIPLSRTTSNVEVEEVLSALSLLLNGGGVAQLQIITQELNKALTGNEPAIRSVLTQLNTFVGTLDQNKQRIVTAITAVDALAKKLNAQKATLATAIDSLPKSIATLDKQRAALVKTLQALATLGNTATRVITASQKDLVANLQSLYPILTKLAEAGENLPKSLELLFTYPFPDAAAKAVAGRLHQPGHHPGREHPEGAEGPARAQPADRRADRARRPPAQPPAAQPDRQRAAVAAGADRYGDHLHHAARPAGLYAEAEPLRVRPRAGQGADAGGGRSDHQRRSGSS